VAHHERPDAAGYPHGVPSGETPLEAQIVAVADVYDAMLSPRPYGPTLAPTEARAELQRVAATQLDAHVVAAFLRVLDDARESGPRSIAV
jgi:HD-GYP domain-containing protein (c-di-GMP phosphodiesterase class II)